MQRTSAPQKCSGEQIGTRLPANRSRADSYTLRYCLQTVGRAQESVDQIRQPQFGRRDKRCTPSPTRRGRSLADSVKYPRYRGRKGARERRRTARFAGSFEQWSDWLVPKRYLFIGGGAVTFSSDRLATPVRFSFLVAHYQIRIHLFHVLREKSELCFAGPIDLLLVTEGNGLSAWIAWLSCAIGSMFFLNRAEEVEVPSLPSELTKTESPLEEVVPKMLPI